MDKDIFKIIKDFISVRSAITLGGFYLAYIIIYQGKVVPDFLQSVITLLLGYWFGQKATQANKPQIPDDEQK